MTQAIFLSYASQDADAARRICEALRNAGLEVWFDQSELRGGDAWDASIRKQIKECALFVPMISHNTNAREEGYFRLEWKLAVDRSHLMADDKTFFVPVILGDTPEPSARVPDAFRTRQWSRLNDDAMISAFATRVAKLVDGRASFDGDTRTGAGINASNTPPVGELSTNATAPRTTSSSPSPKLPPSPQAIRPRTLWITAALILIAAIAITSVMLFPRTSSEAIGSIAVLPFQTKSADTDTDYLADGLAETLIYQLSQVPKIKVTPASSVFRYKGKDVDPLKVGSELGVAAVMTGRLVQRGESLSISVELVDVRHSKSLWGEKYERKLADLLATQREIATEIALKLRLNLSGESARLLTKRFTDNNEAYQLYLKGQYLYAKRGQENLTRAVDFYQQAVRLDPNFAKAHVALADAYSIAAFNGDMSAKEVLPLAAAAAERALAIDPALAEAHAAKASVAAMDWRWEEARRGFARSIELNPDIAETRFRYGLLYLIPMKRAEEAVLEIRRATELEPQAIVMAAVLTRAYLAAGKTQLALEQAKKIYALDPEHTATLWWLVQANLVAGNYAETLELVRRLRSNSFPTVGAHWAITVYMKTGKLEEAKRELRAALDNPSRLQNNAFAIGQMMAAIGNRDEAFAAFERAYAAKEIRLAQLQIEPSTVPLRNDPRFVDLIKRIGLPQ